VPRARPHNRNEHVIITLTADANTSKPLFSSGQDHMWAHIQPLVLYQDSFDELQKGKAILNKN